MDTKEAMQILPQERWDCVRCGKERITFNDIPCRCGASTWKPRDPTEADPINPSHYSEAQVPFLIGCGLFRGHFLGNAVKYIERAGKKPGQTEEQDLTKAVQCIRIYLKYKDMQVKGANQRDWHE